MDVLVVVLLLVVVVVVVVFEVLLVVLAVVVVAVVLFLLVVVVDILLLVIVVVIFLLLAFATCTCPTLRANCFYVSICNVCVFYHVFTWISFTMGAFTQCVHTQKLIECLAALPSVMQWITRCGMKGWYSTCGAGQSTTRSNEGSSAALSRLYLSN